MDSTSRKNRRRSGFKSYISDNYEERAIDVPQESSFSSADPLLFKDEVIIGVAHNVLKYSSLKTNNVVILGTLFITNFKVSFVTSSLPVDTKENELVSSCLQSDFLGLHDICLTEIDAIYSVSEGSKKKKLSATSPLPNKIEDLLLVLKNFRNIHFNFRLTPSKQDTKITKTLLVHRYSQKIDLFFLTLDTPSPKTGIPEFRFVQDWERELSRTKCQNWRISKHNENYKAFPSLPMSFVVPRSITDNVLANSAHHFRSNRPLLWSWGTPRGAAIVRMAQVSSNVANLAVENELIKTIHKCHSQKVPPTILDLDRELPSLKTVQSSFVKLKELHTPDSVSAFADCEKNYLSKWQTSGWLSHIRQSLQVAQHAAAAVHIKNSTIILQEGEGRDWSCVISSLVQILLDPFARTLRGFHTLIQKEWVALGHPFATRLGHLKNNNEDLCPLWLIFLDCVHQISIEHPSALEFSQDYLISLWQSTHCSLHSTFMFDSPKEEFHTYLTLRDESRTKNVYFSPVWSWWARAEGYLATEIDNNILRHSDAQNNVSKDGVQSLEGGFQKITIENNLEKEKRRKRKMREKFLNVLYIQSLLEPLLSPRGLQHLTDPMASTYNTWRRLFHLVGKADSPLPYDPLQPTSPLEQDWILQIPSHFRVRPWVECFALWMIEPFSHSSQGGRERQCLEPCLNGLTEHWKCVYDIILMLQKHVMAMSQNGATS